MRKFRYNGPGDELVLGTSTYAKGDEFTLVSPGDIESLLSSGFDIEELATVEPVLPILAAPVASAPAKKYKEV